MKAFKGCVNESCGVYRKKHYKMNDKFCIECGRKLYFVCADCWKQLENNRNRYCIICEAERKDKKDKRIATGTAGLKNVALGVGVAAVTVKGLADNAEQIQKSARKIADAGVKFFKIVTKK